MSVEQLEVLLEIVNEDLTNKVFVWNHIYLFPIPRIGVDKEVSKENLEGKENSWSMVTRREMELGGKNLVIMDVNGLISKGKNSKALKAKLQALENLENGARKSMKNFIKLGEFGNKVRVLWLMLRARLVAMWNSRCWEGKVIDEFSSCIMVRFKNLKDSSSFLATNIYGPNMDQGRIRNFDYLQSLRRIDKDKEYIVGGDFNALLSLSERKGGKD
ncbi:hypothetical protein SUGI_0297140 [Cryptomeria japonica]|nr:hypothetical protein SUGI_0297140 [Cryptomeria japonica]